MLNIKQLHTRVGLLTFIFDKDDTLVWVLQDWSCIADTLKQELENKIENLDLSIYLVNQDQVDIIIEKKFIDWLDEFEYFKS